MANSWVNEILFQLAFKQYHQTISYNGSVMKTHWLHTLPFVKDPQQRQARRQHQPRLVTRHHPKSRVPCQQLSVPLIRQQFSNLLTGVATLMVHTRQRAINLWTQTVITVSAQNHVLLVVIKCHVWQHTVLITLSQVVDQVNVVRNVHTIPIQPDALQRVIRFLTVSSNIVYCCAKLFYFMHPCISRWFRKSYSEQS